VSCRAAVAGAPCDTTCTKRAPLIDSITARAGASPRLRASCASASRSCECCSTDRPALASAGSGRSRPTRGSSTGRRAGLEDRLAVGYETASEITYVAERDEIAANRTITSTIALLGFVIVAISMVGLANAITTNVLERTREIGILRCIGPRARPRCPAHLHHRRRRARAGGCLLGIPLGYALTRLIVWLVWEVVDVRVPVVFPPWNVLIALVGTLVLALLVLFLPVRRAVRFRPGDAPRYA
jgi:putative ABC transport system permease protein